MLVTLKNSDMIEKLVLIANGDIGLVQRAIRESAQGPDGAADLKKVVDYIVSHRDKTADLVSQPHAAA